MNRLSRCRACDRCLFVVVDRVQNFGVGLERPARIGNMTSPVDIHCPSCGNTGKNLKAITLKSRLTVDALAAAGDLDSYRHCPAPGCDVAYYQPATGKPVFKDAVDVVIGTKETEGPRPVCYCFGHSWQSIEDTLRVTGATDVIETITAHCKMGTTVAPK